MVADHPPTRINCLVPKLEGGIRVGGKLKRSLPGKPLLTVVTAVFNGAPTIEHTILSVGEQTYNNIEHIIIDGGSADGTQDILRKYDHIIDYWVSEKDAGIYDAMNKGIALASGEVVGFLNADDFYASEDVLSKVAAVFSDPDVDACYADLCYVQQENIASVVRYWRSSPFRPRAFEKGWCPPHPTFFVRREIYERLGGFDLSYRIAADVELMMRFLEKHAIRAHYIPEVLVKMRMGGTTNRNLSNIILQNREILRALKLHGLRVSYARFWWHKLLSRGRQFLERPR
jgi:glycosyltransferase involved in cell wall biosynthesis